MRTTTRPVVASSPARRFRPGTAALVLLLVVQAACAIFFVYDIFAGVLGLRTGPIPWTAHELIEISAAVGLVLGIFSAALALRRSDRRLEAAETRLAELSGAFHDLIEDRFGEWALTPAERDVAFFVIKGCTTIEIARLRQTSQGTVKAQTASVYRKAGVSSRAQLLSLFIDDLIGDGLASGRSGDDAA